MKKTTQLIAAATGIAIGSVVGYLLICKPEVLRGIKQSLGDVLITSKKKMDDMSEEVAVRTAKLTRNPKVNQEWVAHQWDVVGY